MSLTRLKRLPTKIRRIWWGCVGCTCAAPLFVSINSVQKRLIPFKPTQKRNSRKTHVPMHTLKQTKCFRMRGKKGRRHLDPQNPTRRRANKRRGHGTYEDVRPLIVSTVGRESGQVWLRVVYRTDRKTLDAHVTNTLKPYPKNHYATNQIRFDVL